MNSANQEELVVNFPIIDASDGDYLALTNSPIGPLIPDLGTELAWLNFAGPEAVTQGTAQAPLFVNADLLQVIDDRVAIDAAGTDAEALLVDLEALGLTDGVAFGNLVSGLMPIEAIDEMANLGSLRFVRPAYKPITNVGSTTSQGDAAMNSDDARTSFGIDGTGITVGVLSDSYDTSNTASTNASDDIASGDLPPANRINVLQDGSSPTTNIDEGRAMMQLIHDVAPGADLAFHTAFGGQAVFAQGIRDLATAGADVIVDDVINLGEPMFQDGIVAQAVDEVVANGVPYFSSAGNTARRSYESAFNPSGTMQSLLGKTYEWHDFDPGAGVDILQEITISEGDTAQFSFQWDEPFFSVSGGSGSTSDIDIFLANGSNIIAGGNASNIGGDAVEVFSYTNPENSGNTSFNLIIGNAGGPNPGLMKYVEFGGITINEYDTASPTSFGHANAAGASSVGAAAYFQTPAFGTSPPVLESFSSPGGVDILFDTAGNRLMTPESRQNVDIVAPDGTNTTFFGQQINDGDSFPNFFGTSAAAPHAAAVAALMLERAGGASSLTPSQVYSALETTAIDMGTAGYDADSGFGLIDANAAVEAVTPPDNVINSGAGRETLTGTAAPDRFVYGSRFDGGDTIVDFTPVDDKINLNGVLSEISYSGSDPITDGYLEFRERSGSAFVMLDIDGPSGPFRSRTLAKIEGVSSAQMNNASNFIF